MFTKFHALPDANVLHVSQVPVRLEGEEIQEVEEKMEQMSSRS